MSTTAVKELAERKVARAKAAQDIMARVEASGKMPSNDERDEVQRLVKEAQECGDQLKAHAEYAAYVKQVEGLIGDETVAGITKGDGSDSAPKADARDDRPEIKTIGAHFVGSDSYKRMAKNLRSMGQVAAVEVDDFLGWKGAAAASGTKATFDTAGSTLTGYDRQAGIILLGTERPRVADLLSRGQTTQNTIRYVREDTFANAAVEVSEGGLKPEASFDTSEQDAPVRKIAVTAKVTDEMFADFPVIRDYINARLPLMVQLREDAQLLAGNGTAPNLRGILNTSGILTQAKGADPVPDAIYKGMVQILATSFFVPDGVVMHPLDWQDVRLLRTADGMYIWGSPADAGPERIWSLPVVITTAMTQNTGLVGAFKLGAQVFYRQGISIESTNSNEDDFKRNLIALRAEQREALAVYRATAFCQVTGI